MRLTKFLTAAQYAQLGDLSGNDTYLLHEAQVLNGIHTNVTFSIIKATTDLVTNRVSYIVDTGLYKEFTDWADKFVADYIANH